MTAKRLTRTALFGAVALIVFLVENAFPPLMSFAPGAKLGLSNAVVFLAIMMLGYTDAFAVLLIKLTLGSVFSGNVAALMYSAPAGLASFAVMALLYRFAFDRIGIPSISLFAAVVFNAVQLGIAGAISGVNLMGLLPVMLVAGVLAGFTVGLICWLTVRYIPEKILFSAR